MKKYRSKVTCEAEVIGKELYDFLTKEGWNNINIGDYYIKGHTDEYSVWSRAHFEVIYEEVI